MRKGCRRALIGAAAFFLVVAVAEAAPLGDCKDGARQYYPCELSFTLQAPEAKASSLGVMSDDLIRVEFRSPGHTTYMIRGFWDGGLGLRVRFTPTEAGQWVYKVTSSAQRLDNQEGQFAATATEDAGMVNVANVRHWRTTNKKPHLWLGAGAPWADLPQAEFETWLDARKKNGFTHIRGTLLNGTSSAQAFSASGEPDLGYFHMLDDRILAVAARGLTADLILIDQSSLEKGIFKSRESLEPVVRYLVARYGGLNVTWQGVERFDETAGARSLLRDIGLFLKKYDGFHHPCSSDAAVSSSPLIADGWMNFIVEESPHAEVAAIEHQFTEMPSIHVISSVEPARFRHELWNATTNGQYPSVPFEALRNETNVKAIETWHTLIAGARHWEFEPFFDVSGARAVAVDGRKDPEAEVDFVECLTYAEKPGIVEVTLPRHKYNPYWVNPATGEETPLKDTRTEVFSRETPDSSHDWILYLPREGQRDSMARSYYFAALNPPVQEPESDAAKTPFEIAEPAGDQLSLSAPVPFQIKLTHSNRATRAMQYVWWGEVVSGGEGLRLLGTGTTGSLKIPPALTIPGGILTLRLQAINANGKAYELDRVYTLAR